MKKIIISLLAASSMFTIANAAEPKITKAVFAGGCFWCMEPPFDKMDGVLDTKSGYLGGTAQNANYKKVVSGTTKHIEAIQITYDAEIVSYEELLKTYWVNIDPFDARGQFCDKGYQYQAALFPQNDDEKALAKASKLSNEQRLGQKFVTKILANATFYPAEEYHQDYYIKNPVRYYYYRTSCGRDNRLESVWGKM